MSDFLNPVEIDGYVITEVYEGWKVEAGPRTTSFEPVIIPNIWASDVHAARSFFETLRHLTDDGWAIDYETLISFLTVANEYRKQAEKQ